MFRKLTLTLTLALLACSLLAQEAKSDYQTSISRDTILIGDQIDWTIRLALEEGEEWTVSRPQDVPTPGVETITPITFDTLSSKQGHLEIEGKVILTSFDSGSYYLPQMVALIARKNGDIDTLVYDSPVLEVTTVPVDTANFQPYDIKGQIKYPLTFGEIVPWIGLALLIAAIIYAIIRYIRMRRENRSFFGKPVVQDPPHIVALRALEKIRSQKLWQNDKQKQFYTAVTDVLRQYIADRYGISALEQTTAEIMDDLKDKEISQGTMDKMKELFTTADYVKFAKHNASELENEEAVPTAVRFVNETYVQQMEEEKEA